MNAPISNFLNDIADYLDEKKNEAGEMVGIAELTPKQANEVIQLLQTISMALRNKSI